MMQTLTTGAHWWYSLDRWVNQFIAPPALLLLAFGALYDVGLGNTGLGVLLIAMMILVPLHWRCIIQDRLVWLGLALISWVLVSAFFHAQARPDWSYTIWNDAGNWLLTPFLGSLAVAFWIARHPRLVPWLLALMVVGYLLRIGEQTSLEHVGKLLQGKGRATFGDSATNFGTWSLLTLLILIALVVPILRFNRRTLIGLTFFPWGVGFVVALGGLILSQGRTAWLAALITLPLMLFFLLRSRFQEVGSIRLVGVVGAAMVILALSTWAMFGAVLEKRFGQHNETILQILSGEPIHTADDSPGFRIRMYIEGFETWTEKPLLGHGPGASEIALAESDDKEIRRFDDFHNSYFVILAEFGLVGFMLVTTLIVTLINRARMAFRSGWLAPSYAYLLLTALLMFAITQLLTYSLHSYRGPFVISLFCGLAWSHWYACRTNIVSNDFTHER